MNKELLSHRFVTQEHYETLISEESIFHTKGWRDMLEHCMHYRSFGLLSSYAERPMLLTLFFETRKGWLRLAGAPLPGSMTPYMHPIWLDNPAPESKKEIFAAQYHFLKQRKYDYIEYRFDTAQDAHMLAVKTDLIATTPETFMLDIQSDEEAMWKKIKSRTRTKINKAKKNGVTVERCESVEEALTYIAEFYRMLEFVFAKSGQKPGQPPACYSRLIENLMPENRLLFLVCRYEGEIATIGIFPYSSDMIYYLSGASHPIAYKVESNALMHWEVIRFAQKNAIKRYDMGGKGIASIDRFKASFGAEPYSYGKLNFKTTLASIAETLYKKIKRIDQ